jgi:hypothetical protein
MSEFSVLIPRLPANTRLPVDEAGIFDLASVFEIVAHSNTLAVLSRFEWLTSRGLLCGTSAYQAILLDDGAYAEWLAYDHVTFEFHGETGYARFVHEHSRRDCVPLSVFEERLKTLVRGNGAISRGTLLNALTKSNYTPKRYSEVKASVGFVELSVRKGRENSKPGGQNQIRDRAKPQKPFIYHGERFPDLLHRQFKNKTEFIRATGTLLPISLVRNRLALGWTMDDAVSSDTDKRPHKRAMSRKRAVTPKAKIIVSPKIPVVYVATSKTTGLKFVGATRKRAPYAAFASYRRTVGKRAGTSSNLSDLDINDFDIEIVEVVEDGDPDLARSRWINNLGTLYPNGYNFERGRRVAPDVEE